jgi:Cdc48 subfamily AAA family protein
MSTRSLTLDEAMRELVTKTRNHLIGQDAAVAAFAAEISRHIALSPVQHRPGIFLVAGPNADDDHLGLPSGLAATFRKAGGLYKLGSSQGEDLAHIFAPLSTGTEVRSLLRSVRDNSAAVFVLRDIDKAHPKLLKALMTAWNQGFIDDEDGEKIPLASSIFILTTEVAQEEIGQIARSEPDPDRLHVACLKLLVDAGFPASLLKNIDTVFALKALTPGEAVLEYCRSFAEHVTSHGLVLEEGGIDGRILAHSMDSSIKPSIEDAWLPRDELDVRLAQAKADGIHTVRLVLGEGIINVVPVGEPVAQDATDLPLDATPAVPFDEEAKGE